MPDACLKSNSTCGLILNYSINFPQVSPRLPTACMPENADADAAAALEPARCPSAPK